MHFAYNFMSFPLILNTLLFENERKLWFFFAFCSLISTFAANFGRLSRIKQIHYG